MADITVDKDAEAKHPEPQMNGGEDPTKKGRAGIRQLRSMCADATFSSAVLAMSIVFFSNHLYFWVHALGPDWLQTSYNKISCAKVGLLYTRCSKVAVIELCDFAGVQSFTSRRGLTRASDAKIFIYRGRPGQGGEELEAGCCKCVIM